MDGQLGRFFDISRGSTTRALPEVGRRVIPLDGPVPRVWEILLLPTEADQEIQKQEQTDPRHDLRGGHGIPDKKCVSAGIQEHLKANKSANGKA